MILAYCVTDLVTKFFDKKIPVKGSLLILILVLQGCQNHFRRTQENFTLSTAQRSEAVKQRIHFLVLHYTAENFSTSLAFLTGKNVSAHYLIPAKIVIDRVTGKPVVWQLVREELSAQHAGTSFWRGWRSINNASIGIEQENPGFTGTDPEVQWYPYPSSQISLVIALTQHIVQRYQISPVDVVGHSDIAPLRKKDPGPLFPWKELADAGVGAWPDSETVTALLAGRPKSQPVAMTPLLSRLARYGYEVTPQMTLAEQKQTVSAFQMHFRPTDFRGEPDAETEAIIDALLIKYYE